MTGQMTELMYAMSTEEFRILYTRNGSVGSNYHYYMAENAKQALDFQIETIKLKGWNIDLLSVERYDRFADKWVAESYVLQ